MRRKKPACDQSQGKIQTVLQHHTTVLAQDHLPVISMEAKLEKALQAEVLEFLYILTARSYFRM